MAKKGSGAIPKCKACGYPMIMDETIIDGRGGRKIKRTFLHCVNGQCGHIQRIGEFPLDPATADAGAKIR
jgi:hypothetical protein